METTYFALRNFKGTPVKWYQVQIEDLEAQAMVTVKRPTHHIIIVDRSGSMYGDIGALKSTIEKLLTLQEFNDPMQRVSLISYSSSGDVKLHFAKITAADVMATASPYLKEIRSIHVTGMTCISQSLVMAGTLVDDNDVTCVTLHSDGYANDRSPSAEVQAIQAALGNLKKHPGVFVNTIAYRDWCDFSLLANVANQMSGVCIQAKDIRQVYGALYAAQGLLAGNLAPAIEVGIGSANYVVFFSPTAPKILGSSGSMQVRGLAVSDIKYAIRLTECPGAPQGADKTPTWAILAYCRALLSEGRLNEAKYALVAAGDQSLLSKHYRALVPSEIAALAKDVESYVTGQTMVVPDTFGLPQAKTNVLEVMNTLSTWSKAITVNVEKLAANYKRRGLKRVAGVRKEDGTLERPKVASIDASPSAYLPLSSVDMNRNTATINILLSKPIRLVKDLVVTDHGMAYEAINEVAGIPLNNLRDYKNYTIVGDGVVCTPILTIKMSDKRCFKALSDLGVVQGDFDPTKEYDLDLGHLPVVDFDASFTVDPTDLTKLARLTVLSKVLSAATKGASEAYTAEQINALKEVYLSPSLYFAPPTTNEYTDLAEALNTGKVDTRISYKVELGSLDMPGVGKFPSANAYLDRRFTLTIDGKVVEKPKWTSFLDPKAVWSVKALGPRIKLTTIDDLFYPVFEAILLGASPTVDGITVSRDGDALIEASKAVDKELDALWGRLSPLVFYIGATGLVPDTLGATKALTADDITQDPRNLGGYGTTKDEKEGTFYILPGNVVVTIYAKGEYFTVGV